MYSVCSVNVLKLFVMLCVLARPPVAKYYEPESVFLASRLPSNGTGAHPDRLSGSRGWDQWRNESRFAYNFPNRQLSGRIRSNGQGYRNFLTQDSALQIGRPRRSLWSKDIPRPTARSCTLQTLYDPMDSNFKLTCDVQYTLLNETEQNSRKWHSHSCASKSMPFPWKPWSLPRSQVRLR